MFDVWNSLIGEYFKICESCFSPQIRDPVIEDRWEIMLGLVDDVACLQSFSEERDDLIWGYWKVLREWLDIIFFHYGFDRIIG